ncbi:hypothetical protein CDQ84_15865 [Clostridium thermosuccinogenes]|uniref:site-specific DNA-methyltransferase (adenine-specific) n=1 Tax=Clostridium thermosuccinogenes TaxID=84032 RepID=A0A2K2FBA5_9CLOT|nr:BREX-1 system adenine-specific DNA-methyltransferase PglX [Pseudoclostridium thermosuccinogenes]AUS98092.1 hypothetical protein CDO33_17535 [Pseudoclostridium thermosuccinogenes]PNT95190.1 hypothetical protein CDQ85_15725 [Pseudoclostridium thermosuccinogenes]PNT96069.1 hypothetical protein CDQ84_15865 [Pseudoclostridium thermosuccinogenes]
MNSEQKKAIKSTILECRDILEKDIEQVLINYGIYINKDWVNLRDLKNLTEEQENNRKNIEKAIEKLEKGGFKRDKAVIEYIKEVSYTYLNRLAALRVMEVRGLIDEILVPRVEYGNKSFINSRFYEVAREFCKYETDGGLGYLLNIMFNEISEEIKILFNTEDEYSFITPSSASLLKVIELLCTNIDEDSWRQDEIIGWIYQYFNDKEKDDVFDRLYNKKQKIYVEDIPAATQLFTPDWIVDWIVDNSLGSLWDEIKQGKRENKKVEDIKLLDPCCGSGHFLVKAFDLFYEMYVEEGLYTKEEIPYKILENNLYGIDIDLRAVQLTSLILFIKVKSSLKENGFNTNTKGKLSVNLVCADAILLNGKRLEELKEKHKDNKPILKMIEIIYEEFEDVRLKGSLIQPEKKLFPLFEEYKNRIALRELSKVKKTKKNQTKGQQNLLEETNEITFSEYKSQRNFSKEERELMISLDAIYSEAIRANDISRQLFASEAKKSVKLVDIFMKQYDVVVTNPPYMGKRSMNDKLKNFIDNVYKDSNNDLYSVFIERCISLTRVNGFIGMITQNTFMFITTYKKVRNLILDNTCIRELVHLGPKAFEDISGEKVNTVMFILEKGTSNVNKIGKYIKLDDIKLSSRKMQVLKEAVNKEKDERVFHMSQSDFDLIEGRSFVYWMDSEIRDIFKTYKPLIEYAKPVVGFQSGKDAYFFRYFWEVKEESIGNRWFHCAKGGEFGRYYKSLPEVVLWENNGKELKEFKGSVIRNESFYFKRGISSSLLGGLNYSARILPDNYLFNVTCVNVFPYNYDNFNVLLGILNSSLSVYMLNLINPTLSITPGTLSKLPITIPESDEKKEIENLTLTCIEIQKKLVSIDETSIIFEGPFLNKYKSVNLFEVLINEILEEYLLNEVLDINSIVIDKYIFDLYEVSEKLREKVLSELKRLPCKEEYLCHFKKESANHEHINIELHEKILDYLTKGYSIYDIAFKCNLDIKRLYDYLLSKKVYTNVQLNKKLKDVISYFVGVIFNRWDNFEENTDGILPLDSSIYLEEDIIEKLYRLIILEFGEENADNVIDEVERILGTSIHSYFMGEFFNDHVLRYKKRPIYWHICSPKKTFNCFLYYHKLDNDTLYKVKSIYLKQMIDRYEEDLKYYTNQLIEARTKGDKSKEKDFKNKCSDLETKLEDLYILDKKIMEILPYKPDIDKGVLYNIIPLEPILASPISTKKEREDYYKEVGKQ